MLVEVVIASAVLASSSSAIILVAGFAFTALTASTVDTTVASPVSSASRIIIDLALETLARFRSSGFVMSPVRVITFSFPRLGTLETISASITARAVPAKITTRGFRIFWLAIASSARIGKTRFDQPRISVWPDSITALFPSLRRATARVMAAEIKPITAPEIAIPIAQ